MKACSAIKNKQYKTLQHPSQRRHTRIYTELQFQKTQTYGELLIILDNITLDTDNINF